MAKIQDLLRRRSELQAQLDDLADTDEERGKIEKRVKQLESGRADLDKAEFFTQTPDTKARRAGIQEEMEALRTQLADLQVKQEAVDGERERIASELAETHRALIPALHKQAVDAIHEAGQREKKARSVYQEITDTLTEAWSTEDAAIKALSTEVLALTKARGPELGVKDSLVDHMSGEVRWRVLRRSPAFSTLGVDAIPSVEERVSLLRRAVAVLERALEAE